MPTLLRSAALASSLLTLTTGFAFAQPKPATPAPEAAQDAPLPQAPLTDKQVQGVLSAQKEINDITSKLTDQDAEKVDPKIQGRLDAVAKKSGFADYAEYDGVIANISLVLSGFDPTTKKFVGPDTVVKKQIAEIQANAQIPPLDKKKSTDELQASLKTLPSIKYPDNIALVTKYYDKLSQALQED